MLWYSGQVRRSLITGMSRWLWQPENWSDIIYKRNDGHLPPLSQRMSFQSTRTTRAPLKARSALHARTTDLTRLISSPGLSWCCQIVFGSNHPSIIKTTICNEEAFLLMWQNLTSIKMRLVHQKISYTFTLYVISFRMAFLHLESKQLSSEDATTKDFFCQVTFKVIWNVIWINMKHWS